MLLECQQGKEQKTVEGTGFILVMEDRGMGAGRVDTETVTGWSVCTSLLRQKSQLHNSPCPISANTHFTHTHTPWAFSYGTKHLCPPVYRCQHADVIIGVISIKFQQYLLLQLEHCELSHLLTAYAFNYSMTIETVSALCTWKNVCMCM